tara:strand:+ start:7693 stop:9096 length:1404 start_codon:yes stop_codon:yes gene_type:complete
LNIHILGICGTLMGSIAILAKETGAQVSGSDEHIYPPMSDQLQAAGIEIYEGYSDTSVPEGTDLVILGNAGLGRGNPAVEHLLRHNIPFISGAEWLGTYLLRDRWVIAIAGTHGKTTTASMVAWILDYAGMEPGYLIGGVPQNFSVSSRNGSHPFFVIEADEYDTSYFDRRSKFLHYFPQTLVMNNLEFDHADIFDTLEDIKRQFHQLVRTVPEHGLIIHPNDDVNLLDVLDRGCWTETQTFLAKPLDSHHPSVNKAEQLPQSDLSITSTSDDFSRFTVTSNGYELMVHWNLRGRHNLHNALAALSAARHAGVPLATGCAALCEFSGVKRRMEIIYENQDVVVYDDFAHHPTAIESDLDGLRRSLQTDDLLIAVIEPASHTMKSGIHQRELTAATAAADHTLWLEPANIGWDMQTLVSHRSHVHSTPREIINHLDTLFKGSTRRCHIALMSNGSFQNLREDLSAHLS